MLHMFCKCTICLPRVLVRAQFEFAQRVTLGANNILTARFPGIRTLTNHIGVSDKGGPKALLFYRPDTADGQSLIDWLAPLVWIRHSLYS